MVCRKPYLLIPLALVALAVGCTRAPTASEPVQKVIFMAGYKPQANLPFLSAYVAQEKGFFAEQGLEVEIRHSAGQGEHYKLLASGQIQFTTAPAEDVIKQVADPGLPFVAVALFGQRGDRGFAVLKDSGINSPKDWEGKTVGYKVFPTPDYLAMLKASGVDRTKLKEVPVGFDPRILMERKVDVYPVFISNEPDILRKLGFEVRVFEAADYGVPTLGLTYIVNRDFLEKEPKTVEGFVKAALKALYYAIDHEEEALDIVMKYAPNEERDHQRYMFQTEKKTALTPITEKNGLGWMTEKQWQDLEESLLEFGALSKPVDVRSVFNDGVLKSIYKNGRLQGP